MMGVRPRQNSPASVNRSSRGSPPPCGVRDFEDVGERAPDLRRGHRVGIAGDAAGLDAVVAPDLVEAHHVVGVAVREEDRVDARQPEPQGLRTQVRRRVHQHRQIGQLDVDGGPRCGCRAGRRTCRHAHAQPIIGTPCEVPVPRKVTRARPITGG